VIVVSWDMSSDSCSFWGWNRFSGVGIFLEIHTDTKDNKPFSASGGRPLTKIFLIFSFYGLFVYSICSQPGVFLDISASPF
jgi:hypothetical protein